MYKSLNIKLVLIFIVFIISVMTTVGVILLNSIYSFYTNDFLTQVEESFTDRLVSQLTDNLGHEDFPRAQKDLLSAYSGSFGFDVYRNFYILDLSGNVLASSAVDAREVTKTQNLLTAMNKGVGNKQVLGADFLDYALYLEKDGNECIIYILDSLTRMKSLIWVMFSIIIQTLLIGLVIAVILSFFLAKAITLPIQNLTKGTMQIASGEYSHRLVNHSKDEIGVLTKHFNTMAQTIENTLDAVSREREKLQSIFSCLEAGVAAFDQNGELLHINPAAVKMLSLQTGSQPNFLKFTEALGLPEITTELLCSTDNINILEHKLSEEKNNELIVDVGFTVFIYDGNKKGYIAVVQNITERALLDKRQREFIANVSHELRTPLTSIKGATETVLSDEEMPLSIRSRFLNIVMNEADRMTRIVKDLLVLSRLDNKRMSWQPSSFSVYDSLSQICEALEPEAHNRGHSLTLDAEKDRLDNIFADKERIEQVFTNIIGNAIKYTPKNGKIEVSVRDLKNKAFEIKVKDNGVGIPKEDLPRLFERFYRVDKARTSDMGGTGLGLSIAKEIIDAHNGKITVESAEGKGTTVIIVLPKDTGIGKE